MTSVLKYLRRKIKPIKRCILSNFEKKKIHPKPCKRSNTTFTIVNSKSAKIIDYFDQLDVKRTSLTRHLSSNSVIENLDSSSNSETNMEDKTSNENTEVDKIEDAFFNDDLSIINKTSTAKFHGQDNDSLISKLDSSVSTNNLDFNQELHQLYSLEAKNDKTYKAVSRNSSFEVPRHTLSILELNKQNSTIFSDVSKTSYVTNFEKLLSEESILEDSLKLNSENLYQDENATPDLHNENICFNGFKRGDPHTRMSKNIKQMFKNVIKYQMNALTSLEKFYESQIIKIEAERERNLMIDSENKESINQYFDNQLKLLEERVYSNLKFICQNKNSAYPYSERKLKNEFSSNIVENNNNNTTKNCKLTDKIAQLILLKQIENNKDENIQRYLLSKKSEKVNKLNQNYEYLNQTHNITSRSINNLNLDQHYENGSNEEQNLKKNMFKRNFSLPFEKCRNPYRYVENDEPRNSLICIESQTPKIKPLACNRSKIKPLKKYYGSLVFSSSPISIMSNSSNVNNSNNISLKRNYSKSRFRQCASNANIKPNLEISNILSKQSFKEESNKNSQLKPNESELNKYKRNNNTKNFNKTQDDLYFNYNRPRNQSCSSIHQNLFEKNKILNSTLENNRRASSIYVNRLQKTKLIESSHDKADYDNLILSLSLISSGKQFCYESNKNLTRIVFKPKDINTTGLVNTNKVDVNVRKNAFLIETEV